MPEPIAYLNGGYVPFSACRVHVTDPGVVQAVTAVDRLRTFRHRPFLLDEHLDRFDCSREAIGIELQESRRDLVGIVQRVVAESTALIAERDDLAVVLLATPGHCALNSPIAAVPSMPFDVRAASGELLGRFAPEGPGGSPEPTLCVHTLPLDFARWAAKYDAGEHLVIPSVRQVPRECIDPRIKHRSRLHWYLAEQEARRADPEATAVLPDRDGHVTETSAANVFIVRGGRLVTPRPEAALPGISQAYVRRLAAELGIDYHTSDLTPGNLYAADEVLLSSTSFCLLPVTRVDGRAISDGRPGPVFRRLIEAWSRRVGVDIIAQAQSE
jgi:branched-subunit amino acid aminotransferase/4-amino-4-deoxychorismate lyase